MSIETATTSITTIAHVVSLIDCHKGGPEVVTGFLDAAAVLRHSIHQQSNYTGASRYYSYHMVAFVHVHCTTNTTTAVTTLRQLGYDTRIVAPPIRLEELPVGSLYRRWVRWENCCGLDEFIKLWAYHHLTEYPIFVHWDLDALVLQPMDVLFDAMLFPANSTRGRVARAQLELQHPHVPLPNVIDAFITRDVTSSEPGEVHQGVQGGFLVARPNPQHFQIYLQFIRQANYTRGRGPGSGWGGMGYGGFQGAMAFQGAVAYFYDQYQPNTAVELNVCRWNQVVADVVWRGPTKLQYNGTCKDYPEPFVALEQNTECEDCRITPIELVKTVHYTACHKPWECSLPYPWQVKDNPGMQHVYNELTNVTTCGWLLQKWFDARRQVDELLQSRRSAASSNDKVPAITPNGTYHPEYFLGYCHNRSGYIPMEPLPANLDMNTLYFV